MCFYDIASADNSEEMEKKCFNITSKTVDEVSALAFALNRVHSGFESVNQ